MQNNIQNNYSIFKEDFFKLCDDANNIVVTSHMSPDEDSIAAVLSLQYILKAHYPNKDIRIIYGGERPSRFEVIDNYEKIEFVSDISLNLKVDDLLIMADGGQFSRFSTNPEKLQELAAQGMKTICLDHHASPADNFNLSLIDKNIPAAAELIYRIFILQQEKEKGTNILNATLAKIFLLGILGDTGNMSFIKPSQTETLLIVKNLLDHAQIEIQDFQASYRSISERAFLLIQEFMKNVDYHSIGNWPGFMTSYLSREFQKVGGYSDMEVGEAKRIFMAHYIRLIEGYPWGFVVVPKQSGDANVSFRSLPGSVNVRQLAETMGIGGGHDRAAGAAIKQTDTSTKRDGLDAIDEITSWIESNEAITG